MDKQKINFIFLSLILITAFGLYTFFEPAQPPLDEEPNKSYVLDYSVDQRNSLDKASDYKELLSLGLSDEQAKRLILQELKDIHSSTQSQDIYWKTTTASKAALVRQHYVSQQKIRDALIARFGQSTWDEPLFSEVFLPLQKQFPFLTAQEQIALQKFQIDRQIAMMSAPQTSPPFQLSRQNPQRLASRPVTPLSGDVSSILSEKSAFEYNLRMSMLAHQFRASEVDFTENTFRRAYRLLEDLFPARASVTPTDRGKLPDSTLVDRRYDLNELVGAENTLKLMATLDPEFREIQRRAGGLNLNEEQILTAYEISLAARKAIFDGVRAKEVNPQIGVEMIRDAANTQWNQISTHLGEEVAEKLLGSTSHRLRNQPPKVFTPSATIVN
ncbi:hypothetical protein OAE19_03520 [Porticoccaceae bacterium]|nr:hypothetical protein [Porticoccaceae bacterium]MDC0003445.1 hypothetical protein [Porticoccaceae bacterium]